MIGDFIHEIVFQKVVEPQHFMRKFEGVGLSESALFELRKRGVGLVRIIFVADSRPTKVFYASVRQFLQSVLSYENPDLVGDVQRFVKLEEMIER